MLGAQVFARHTFQLGSIGSTEGEGEERLS